MDYAVISRQGGRPLNEDSYSISKKGGSYCFTVCDGLGGHAKGEVASQTASEVFKDTFEDYDGKPSAFFESAFKKCAEEFRRLAGESSVLELMKTTVVSAVADSKKISFTHIGDSRLYGFTPEKAELFTDDHSVPEMLVKTGEITKDEIRNHPDRNKLLRCLAVSDEPADYEPVREKTVKNYSAFLLCTDGFWELIDEKTMLRYLKWSKNAEQWLELMTRRVERAGRGRQTDNYTAIAVFTGKGVTLK